ncbi:hypothetical protein [Candidatus Hodgkinia cicadicola]
MLKSCSNVELINLLLWYKRDRLYGQLKSKSLKVGTYWSVGTTRWQ